MMRATTLLSLVMMVLAGILSPTSGSGGRTLSLAEQESIRGGQDNYCCGLPSKCYVPKPNPACNTYAQGICGGKKYYFNPINQNDYACVIVAPGAVCLGPPPYTNTCLYYYLCAWDDTTKECIHAHGYQQAGSERVALHPVAVWAALETAAARPCRWGAPRTHAICAPCDFRTS